MELTEQFQYLLGYKMANFAVKALSLILNSPVDSKLGDMVGMQGLGGIPLARKDRNCTILQYRATWEGCTPPYPLQVHFLVTVKTTTSMF